MNYVEEGQEGYGAKYVLYPGSTAVGQVLRDYQNCGWDYYWLLISKQGKSFEYCSFGSLLPYLTGRTAHIVHTEHECAICSALDPIYWQATEGLVAEALADESISSRLLADLPLADMYVVDVQGESLSEQEYQAVISREWQMVVGVSLNGEMKGVFVNQMKSLDDSSVPDY